MMSEACPKCGDPYLYASEDERGVLFVHGFEYVEEVDDLVRQACWVTHGEDTQPVAQEVDSNIEIDKMRKTEF